jgi:hypothetical protein
MKVRTTLIHKKKKRREKKIKGYITILDTCDGLIFVLSEPRSRPPDANPDEYLSPAWTARSASAHLSRREADR